MLISSSISLLLDSTGVPLLFTVKNNAHLSFASHSKTICFDSFPSPFK